MSRSDKKKSREAKKPKQAETTKAGNKSEYAQRQASAGSTDLKIRAR